MLKSLGLKFESSISDINCLENDKSTNFDVKDFSAYFSNLTANFMSKLSNSSNKFGVLSVGQYYSHLVLTKNFDLLPTKKNKKNLYNYDFERCQHRKSCWHR